MLSNLSERLKDCKILSKWLCGLILCYNSLELSNFVKVFQLVESIAAFDDFSQLVENFQILSEVVSSKTVV